MGSSKHKIFLVEPGGSDDDSDWEDVASEHVEEEPSPTREGSSLEKSIGDGDGNDGNIVEGRIDLCPPPQSEMNASMGEPTPDLVLSLTGQSESSQDDTGKDNDSEACDSDNPKNLEEVYAIVVDSARKPDNDDEGKDHTSTPRRNHPMSSKILERTEWLSGLFDTDSPLHSNSKNNHSPDSTEQQETAKLVIAKKRKSKLVVQRLEWLLEQMSTKAKGGPSQQSKSDNSIQIPEGVTSDLSKRWQAFVEAHATAGQSWEQLQLRQQWRKVRSHEQDGDSQPPTSSPVYESSKPTTRGDNYNEKQLLGATTSDTDKSVWFLEEMGGNESIRPEQQALLIDFMQQEEKREAAAARSAMDTTHYLLGDDENGEHCEEDSSFLARALTGLEQEGVLPGFLADWLGGAVSTNDETFEQPLHILRLDYQPEYQLEKDAMLTLDTETLISTSKSPLIPVSEPGTPPATTAPAVPAAASAIPPSPLPVIAAPTALTERIKGESMLLGAREADSQSSASNGLLHRTRSFFVNPESYPESIRPDGGRCYQQQHRPSDSKSSAHSRKMDESLTFNDHAIFLEDGGLLMSMPWSEMS